MKKGSCKDELSEWLNRQEILWRQKSGELWLTVGDQNSKFFLATTFTNSTRIFITTLKSNNGEWLETQGQIGSFLTDEFTKLFKTDTATPCTLLRDYTHNSITNDQNCSLLMRKKLYLP